MTAADVSVGLKSMAAIPGHLRSCINVVGGDGDAESRISPSAETARTFGCEGCALVGGSRSPVESEYVCIEVLSVLVKKRVCESGEKSRSRGVFYVLCQYVHMQSQPKLLTSPPLKLCFFSRNSAASCRIMT